MRRLTSFLLIAAIIISMSSLVSADAIFSHNDSESFSYVADDGDIITVVMTKGNNTATAQVYENGVLIQESTADGAKNTVDTFVYDLPVAQNSAAREIETDVSDMNGFVSTVRHMLISNETCDVTISAEKLNESSRNTTISPRASNSLIDEPVDNTGLRQAYFGGGYYNLGSDGGYYYAPTVYGYLFRSYTQTYDGETHYWTWDAMTTVSAIVAVVGLVTESPVAGIIGILQFTVESVLAYKQSVELATYTFNYNYIVRVHSKEYFSTVRNITYWRIDNVTEDKTEWVEKRFNYGYAMSNIEMVKAGIDEYLLSTM